ncbi:sigma-70 family RNA polymerase sigma factor [Chitinophaga horti]|uniref:Sigma-70 family RNA polymerase sigma factor n=1 Tax=Chitinophaga horti TaxID=2920382 RepID=A0ABY6J3A8_9BACT|nr:sigma-70 family RNA polymerase sigma factor [Chitinophaga horti]UYQ94063.1 sigma-70 family RNA polymerase sigma factor [Chitinophaga horti]
MPSNAHDNNQDLLLRVSQGDEHAFRELLHTWADPLHNYIYQLTRCTQTAEEIVQDIFLQIWTTRETLAGIRNLPAYLFVISRNQALNALKKALRQRKRQQAWEALQTDIADTDTPDHEPVLGLIESAIAQLPPQQQKVWILSRRQGRKYQEIAGEMGISRETVKKYLQYANQSIAEYVTARADHLLLCCLFLLL